MLRAFPLLLLAGLAGCDNTYLPNGDMSSDFGNSVRANIALQVVRPLPTRLRPEPNSSAARMDSAFVRYETNRVYQPKPVQSLQGGPNSANGGGGNDSPPPASPGGGTGQN